MKLILVLIALFLTATFAQVSVAYYSDADCTKIALGKYYPAGCSKYLFGSVNFQCSADGSKIVQNTFSGSTCAGSFSLSVGLNDVGTCVKVNDYTYYKAWCAAALPTSGVVSTRWDWMGGNGCETTASSFTYYYEGCHVDGGSSSKMYSCVSGLDGQSSVKSFSDKTCAASSGTIKQSDNVKCAFNLYGQVCGFVSGVSATGLSFVIIALIALFSL